MPDIIAGRNPVLEALKTGRLINKVLIERGARNEVIGKILDLARAHKIPVEFIEKNFLERLTPKVRTQGIAAYTSRKAYTTLDDMLVIPKAKNEAPLFIVLDGIEDPQNLGAILRTVEAAGGHGVIVRNRRAAGLTPSVARASAGAVEYIPVARVTNIVRTIRILKEHGIWIIGIDTDGKSDYTGVDFKLPTAIVIGSEGKGLSNLVRKHCDVKAFIPMKGKIGSLNASAAAAVAIYEALKQRS